MYLPALPVDGPGMREPIALERLREQAKRAVEGDVEAAMPQIMEAGTSAGGARAKALVYWNRTSNAVMVGSAATPGYEPWLVKFDGVSSDGDRFPWTRMEFAYNEMARAAGLALPPSCLIEASGFQHFAVRRFDVAADGRRLHMHSLCGLQHMDYKHPQAAGYELLLRSCLSLNLGAGSLREAYRRMVFNVVARNQDDHTKNFAFLMDPKSFLWELAPAFDVTYANGSGWTASHQMTINGKDRNIWREDLLAVGEMFDIETAETIIADVAHAVRRWPEFANGAGLPQVWTERIKSAVQEAWADWDGGGSGSRRQAGNRLAKAPVVG